MRSALTKYRELWTACISHWRYRADAVALAVARVLRCRDRESHLSAPLIAAITFTCAFGTALIGAFVRDRLPAPHLSKESQDVVRLGMGLVAFLLAGPGVGIVIGLAAGLGARHETFRRYLLLGSPLAMALCAAYVIYIQFRWAPMPSFEWPIEMRRVHLVGWLAVLLLVTDVVVDRVWQSRRTDEE